MAHPGVVPPESFRANRFGCPSQISRLVGVTGTIITMTPTPESRLGAAWELSESLEFTRGTCRVTRRVRRGATTGRTAHCRRTESIVSEP
jgi:hypothetical protein